MKELRIVVTYDDIVKRCCDCPFSERYWEPDGKTFKSTLDYVCKHTKNPDNTYNMIPDAYSGIWDKCTAKDGDTITL